MIPIRSGAFKLNLIELMWSGQSFHRKSVLKNNGFFSFYFYRNMFYKVFRLPKATSFGASSLYLVYCLLLEPFLLFQFVISLLFSSEIDSYFCYHDILSSTRFLSEQKTNLSLWKIFSHNVQLDLVKLFRFYDELINELLFQT